METINKFIAAINFDTIWFWITTFYPINILGMEVPIIILIFVIAAILAVAQIIFRAIKTVGILLVVFFIVNYIITNFL